MAPHRRLRVVGGIVGTVAIGGFLLLSLRHGKPGASPNPAQEAVAPPTVSLEPEQAPSIAAAPEQAPFAARTTEPAPPAPDARMTELALMDRLRAVESTQPEVAVALAREGNRRFPNSPDSPERSSILIHALSALGRGSEARGEAEHMVNHFPDSPWVQEIEQFTGAHRHRNVRLNDAGRVEYYDP